MRQHWTILVSLFLYHSSHASLASKHSSRHVVIGETFSLMNTGECLRRLAVTCSNSHYRRRLNYLFSLLLSLSSFSASDKWILAIKRVSLTTSPCSVSWSHRIHVRDSEASRAHCSQFTIIRFFSLVRSLIFWPFSFLSGVRYAATRPSPIWPCCLSRTVCCRWYTFPNGCSNIISTSPSRVISSPAVSTGFLRIFWRTSVSTRSSSSILIEREQWHATGPVWSIRNRGFGWFWCENCSSPAFWAPFISIGLSNMATKVKHLLFIELFVVPLIKPRRALLYFLSSQVPVYSTPVRFVESNFCASNRLHSTAAVERTAPIASLRAKKGSDVTVEPC